MYEGDKKVCLPEGDGHKAFCQNIDKVMMQAGESEAAFTPEVLEDRLNGVLVAHTISTKMKSFVSI